jgi:hypothetical protein
MLKLLSWRGEEIKAKIAMAEERAVNRIMADCVQEAQKRAPVDAGILRDDIQVLRPAAKAARGHSGYWGVRGGYKGGWYVWIVHHGSRAHMVRGKRHPGFRGRPFLRQAVDAHYPKLAKQVKAEMKML